MAEHENFPFLEIPQRFQDDRGMILNIADGSFGDVAIIESKKGSVRANHFHKNDWHLTYILHGAAFYSYKKVDSTPSFDWVETKIEPRKLLYTPNETWHRFKFIEDTLMIVVSGLSRRKEIYDSDTIYVDKE